MGSDIKRYGTWALVAGAAEGLGAAFSEALARQGMNLVMADISLPSLEALGPKLEATYGIQTRRLHLDLSAGDAAEQCMASVSGLDCRLLVYNAAFSIVTPFLSLQPSDLDRFINVNARSVVHLAHAFSRGLVSRREKGGILLMGSLSGVVAPPLVSVYASTKAFNIRLAEAMSVELGPLGIDVTACVAGITDTEKFRESRPVFSGFKPQVQSPRDVAEYALRNMGRKPMIVPGLGNRISLFFLRRLLPSGLARRFVKASMVRLYPGRLVSPGGPG